MATLGMNYAPITALPPPGAFTLTTTPDGGWPGNQITNAIYYNGYSYYTYIDGSGNLELRSLADGATVSSAPLTVVPYSDWLEIDWHDPPAILVRDSDHKLVLAYCRHASGADMYINFSVNSLDTDPTLSGGLAGGTDIAATIGGSEFTYPRLYQLTSEASDPIYLFWRSYISGKSTLLYSKSTNGGVTWASRVAVFQQNAEAYWSIDCNGTDRFDFAITDGSGGSSNVLHFYYLAGSYYKTDGTLIGTTTVATAGASMVASAVGAFYIGGISRNAGSPVIVYSAGGTETYYYASWSGAAWVVNSIVAAGVDPLIANYGGLVVDTATPTVVYLSKRTTGVWQVFRYTTANAGATWTPVQLTTDSDDSVYPIIVRSYGATLRVLWLNGSAVSYLSYTFGMVGIA